MGLPSWLPGRPGGDPEQLQQMATLWSQAASGLEPVIRQTIANGDNVGSWWSGAGATAFTDRWSEYANGMFTLQSSMREVSQHLSNAASTIASHQAQYDHYAELAGEIATGGLFLTMFTAGFSDLLAGLGEAGIIGAVTALIAELATAVEAIAETIEGLLITIDGALASLTVTLGPYGGLLLSAGAGAAFSTGFTLAAGDDNPIDLTIAALFGASQGAAEAPVGGNDPGGEPPPEEPPVVPTGGGGSDPAADPNGDGSGGGGGGGGGGTGGPMPVPLSAGGVSEVQARQLAAQNGFPVPDNFVGQVSESGKGWTFTLYGPPDPRATRTPWQIRVMDPGVVNGVDYPNGYIRVMTGGKTYFSGPGQFPKGKLSQQEMRDLTHIPIVP